MAAAPAGESDGGTQARLDQLQQLAALHAQGILSIAEVSHGNRQVLDAIDALLAPGEQRTARHWLAILPHLRT